MTVELSYRSSIEEVLWNFSRLIDENHRLTLKDNPHFYINLPTSPDAFRDSIKIDPTEDFQHADRFHVLVDKPELVHIMSDQVLQSQSFGNFWCPKNAIILKGLGIFLFSPCF